MPGVESQGRLTKQREWLQRDGCSARVAPEDNKPAPHGLNSLLQCPNKRQ